MSHASEEPASRGRVVLFANTEWYLYNFRRSLALALQQAGYEVILISPPGAYGEKLVALGLHWQPVPMDRRSLNPILELRLLWHLWRLFRRTRPDLVHGFTIKCAVYGALTARMAGIRARVSAVAGMGYVFTSSAIKARLLRVPVRLLLRISLGGRGSRLILQNTDDRALFESEGLFKPSRIRLIPGSGVDVTRFRVRGEPRGSGEPFVVLLAARLLRAKGVFEYVAAVRQLRLEGRDIRFLLAGCPDPGNPDSVPEDQVRAWHDAGFIEWLGHVDDMPSLLERIDVMALPTAYGEGLPKSLIEAAACALPLVATDVPGCREVVEHEVTGLLIPPRDADALARAIARLHDDPDLRERLGAAASKKTLESFDERIVIRKTIDVYNEVIPTGS